MISQFSSVSLDLETLDHAHRCATLWSIQPLDFIHETAYQEHTPSRSLQNVRRIGRVGHIGRIESLALILNFDLEFVLQTIECYLDRFSFIFLIAVHDRVRYGFAHGHVNSKRNLLSDAAALNKIRYGGSGPGNRFNVAGQNESSRLVGHKKARPLSPWNCVLAAAK
jgi:hypothetical protein